MEETKQTKELHKHTQTWWWRQVLCLVHSRYTIWTNAVYKYDKSNPSCSGISIPKGSAKQKRTPFEVHQPNNWLGIFMCVTGYVGLEHNRIRLS